MYRDRMNVEHETDISWGHWNSDKIFKEKLGKHSIVSLQPKLYLEHHTIREVLQSET
jgi:hypothetical protein